MAEVTWATLILLPNTERRMMGNTDRGLNTRLAQFRNSDRGKKNVFKIKA